MKLKSYNCFYCLLIIFLFFSPLKSEEQIDIWKTNKEKKQLIKNEKNQNDKKDKQELNLKSIQTIKVNKKITIEDALNESKKNTEIFGVYDPADNDFNLNMWSSTNSEDIKASLARLKKIKLSSTANEILEKILLSFSYAPKGMNEQEFADLKISWLINRGDSDLIESLIENIE